MASDDKDIYDVAEQKFLQEHLGEKVNIYLTSGTKLECEIKDYDEGVIVATQKNKTKRQLIYKTSISTIAEE